MASRSDTQPLRSRTDFLIAGYLLTTALLLAAFHDRVPRWELWVLAHVAMSTVITGLSLLPNKLSGALQFFRDWYPVMLLPLLFKEVEVLAAGFGNWGLVTVFGAFTASAARAESESRSKGTRVSASVRVERAGPLEPPFTSGRLLSPSGQSTQGRAKG